jgi:manganese transport protein
VFVGALAQGLMLPFLALAALYFHHRRIDPALRTGTLWTACLWLATVAMSVVGIYQVLTTFQRLLT